MRRRQLARAEDVAPHGHAVNRATVRQKKTGQPVRFEMTEQTREAVDSYIEAASKKLGDFLFSGRRGRDRPITTRQYARLVCRWIASIGLDPNFLARTHSVEPRRHSSTAALATCGQYSFYRDTRRSRARYATSALRSMTLSPWPNRSTSDLPGQSRIALPLPQHPSGATNGGDEQTPDTSGVPRAAEFLPRSKQQSAAMAGRW